MKRILTLSVFPLIALALFIASYLWSGRDLRLRFQGKETEGRIVGMALDREGTNDLVTALDTKLDLLLADGTRIEALYHNYALTSATEQAPAGGTLRTLTARELDGSAETSATSLSPELLRVLNDAVKGEAAIVRWALLRENRRIADPRRVVRIVKTETVHGYFGLKEIPPVLKLRDGRVTFDKSGANAPDQGTVVIRGVFDFSDPARVKANKGNSLVDYEYLRLGESLTPEKKNFFLFAEPYATQFLPVFGFEANGQPIARLSHIGRRGGPTLALQLYGNCMVYYDAANPAEAILIATPGPVDGAPLAWFSRLCEGVFAQWGSAALIALAGLLFIGTGLLFLSLLLFPSKNLPPPPVTTP